MHHIQGTNFESQVRNNIGKCRHRQYKINKYIYKGRGDTLIRIDVIVLVTPLKETLLKSLLICIFQQIILTTQVKYRIIVQNMAQP